ncbi:MAG: hypothetical protein QW793_04770 [Candidatus Caldarchaeum sp.]
MSSHHQLPQVHQSPQLPAGRTTDYRLSLRTIDEIKTFAQIAVESKLLPPGLDTWQKVMIVLQCGAELGLEPLQALQGIAVINNRPVVYGDTLLALCMSSPDFDHSVFDEKPVGEQGTENYGWSCTVGRKGRKQPVTRVFTVKMARQAGLLQRDTWVKYLDRMLQMRARAWALRDTFADRLRGLMIKEEYEDVEVTKTQLPTAAQSAGRDAQQEHDSETREAQAMHAAAAASPSPLLSDSASSQVEQMVTAVAEDTHTEVRRRNRRQRIMTLLEPESVQVGQP